MAAEARHGSFSLGECAWLGFDLDHTLVRYKLDALHAIIHEGVLGFLAQHKSHRYEGLGECKADPAFLVRGLFFDKQLGNLVLLDERHHVAVAYHGTRRLGDEEIARQYEDTLSEMPDLLAFHSAQRPDRLWPLNTWFDVSAAHMLALLVDRCDRQHPQADAAERARLYREVFVDMVAGFELGFSEYDKGWYFPALARVSEAGEAVGDFVFRRPEVVAWLQRLRRAGRRLFLVTNSKLDYATLLCNYALGREWQQLFDVVVVQANKGQFFTERRPFRLTDPATLATSPVEVAPAELRVGAVYALGNSADLHALFERESGAGARVAYFGDHLNTDVMCAARFTPWLPVAVVEELEQFTGPARPDVTPLRDSLDFGSYFFTPAGRRTFWFDHLLRHAALVVPDVAWLAEVDLERRFAFRAAEPLCCVAEPRPTRRDADEAAREAVRGGGGVSA